MPLRSDDYLQQFADSFNIVAEDRGIGVVFNAYNLKTGKAALFGNPTARALWPKSSKLPRTKPSHDARYQSTKGAPAAIEPITLEAVKAALWLSLYGFQNLQGDPLDGAYHRPCLVSELYKFDTIFAVRPLANGWLGSGPSNWFEVQDWQCEMWFSAGYKAEVDALMRINDLIENGVITDPDYKKVDLIHIEPDSPAGYFNFFTERKSVFVDALEKGKTVLAPFAGRK